MTETVTGTCYVVAPRRTGCATTNADIDYATVNDDALEFNLQRGVAIMFKTLASFVGLLAVLFGATVSAQTYADSDFKVTLLSTGMQIPYSGPVRPKHACRSRKSETALFPTLGGAQLSVCGRSAGDEGHGHDHEQDRCALPDPLSF